MEKVCFKTLPHIRDLLEKPPSYHKRSFKNFLIEEYRSILRHSNFNQDMENAAEHFTDPKVWQQEDLDHLRTKITHHLTNDHLRVFEHLMAGYRPIDVARDLGLRNPRRFVNELREFVGSHQRQ